MSGIPHPVPAVPPGMNGDPRIAFVLGAGGVAGWLWHAGVIDALADQAGWDAHAADLVIGTSAGAAVAAGLRYGATADEFVGAIVPGPTAAERAEFRKALEGRTRTWRPPAPGLLRHVLPGGSGWLVAAAGVIPSGIYPTYGLGRFPGVNGHESWPDGLWIPATDATSGGVVVFGRDRHDVDVHDAVEASSAVPGLFEPKPIDGRHYLDGGLTSPTHADLAAGADLVIVSSPMTRPSRRPLAAFARRRLFQELRALHEAGVPALVIQPEDGEEAFRGFPRRNPAGAPVILDSAAAAVRHALAAPEAAPLAARV